MSSAVEVNGISKRYRLGADVGYDTVRDALMRAVRRRPAAPEIWALRDVTFDVEQGEALGIIGPNGAGKTTLLKLLTGITEPTAGEARTRGRVGPLLDVGTGFHPELTGHENVYLNGAILGMRRAEVRRRFDSIIEFAGVERFVDTPVKRYSDGMRLRLAFAIAAHLEPPIMVVDEVLAVGDAAFREKCLGKMSEIGTHGRTVLFVSHDLGAITKLCSRAIWLEDGWLQEDGPAPETISSYIGSGAGRPLVAEFPDGAREAVVLREVAIRDPDGGVLISPARDKPFVVDLRFLLRERTPGLDIGISLIDGRGNRVIYDARADWSPDGGLPGDPGLYGARATVPGLLTPGRYAVEVWIGTEHETLEEREVLSMQIAPRADDRQEWIDRPRIIQPRVEWDVEHEPLVE